MRHILCLDLEATGTDVSNDRIVEFAASWVTHTGAVRLLINPGMPIPPRVTEIHGISDADVADKPTFSELAKEIHDLVKDCDLLGFNLTNFDVPMLWEEFYRAGIIWDLRETKIFDAGTLFKKMEGRTLSDAVRFYCGEELVDAHSALADVQATAKVWQAQIAKYGLDPNDRDALQKASNYDEVRVDLAGKIVLNAEGIPVWNFSTHKGIPVVESEGFALWVLQRDFSENTKIAIRNILQFETEAFR